MLKGFAHARLACGCRLAFREGTSGSPVTVVIDRASPVLRRLMSFDYPYPQILDQAEAGVEYGRYARR